MASLSVKRSIPSCFQCRNTGHFAPTSQAFSSRWPIHQSIPAEQTTETTRFNPCLRGQHAIYSTEAISVQNHRANFPMCAINVIKDIQGYNAAVHPLPTTITSSTNNHYLLYQQPLPPLPTTITSSTNNHYLLYQQPLPPLPTTITSSTNNHYLLYQQPLPPLPTTITSSTNNHYLQCKYF